MHSDVFGRKALPLLGWMRLRAFQMKQYLLRMRKLELAMTNLRVMVSTTPCMMAAWVAVGAWLPSRSWRRMLSVTKRLEKRNRKLVCLALMIHLRSFGMMVVLVD